MADLPRSGPAVRELDLPLPPSRMPMLRAGRPLKRWRYVGVYGPDLMLCAAEVRIGPLRQQWWAAATPDCDLLGRTSLRSAGVTMNGSRVRVASRGARIELEV